MQKNVGKFGFSDKRGRTPTSVDPYLQEHSLKEPALCQGCKAIYRNKRWQWEPREVEEMRNDPGVTEVTCPACQKIAGHDPEGIFTLQGDYLWQHEQEIRNLLNNEAERVLAKNPISKIMQVNKTKDGLVIETTEQKLAEHLGRILNRAHSGELQVSWSQSPRVCRVTWERWE